MTLTFKYSFSKDQHRSDDCVLKRRKDLTNKWLFFGMAFKIKQGGGGYYNVDLMVHHIVPNSAA